MTTPTPRTDALEKAIDACAEYRKQLDEAKAEVERLKEQLMMEKAKIKDLTPCGCDNYLQITCKKHTNK